MGKNIKRLSLALLALGLSAPAFADTCNPFNVTVPNQQGGFTIGADALYLQPSVGFGGYNSSLDFATPVTIGTTTTVNGNVSSVDPSYRWGFDVTAAYRIAGTGNDISATWTHLSQNSDSDTTATPNVAFGPTTPFGEGGIILPAGTYNVANTGSLQFDYDAVDVDVGQRVNFGDYFQFRTFAGVRWAQVEADRDSTLHRTLVGAGATTGLLTDHVEQNSKFDGVGPQLGLDGRYCLGYGFGLDANLTASLLIGKTDSSFRDAILAATNSTASPTLTQTGIVNLDADSKTRVVPAIDASLGLDYTYNFNNCDRSSLVVQAGWKVINYFDAAQHVDPSVASTFGGFATTVVGGNNSNNIAFQGPYAGIKVNL